MVAKKQTANVPAGTTPAVKKPSVERAWKIAAIDRYIADQQALISKLDAAVKEFPLDTPIACPGCWRGNEIRKANPHCERCGGAGVPSDYPTRVAGARAAARKRLAELKKQKRRPGTLLTAAHLLRDREGLDRLKRFPKGTGDVLAALDIEQQRLTAQYGSVDAYTELQNKQRELAARKREVGTDGQNMSQLVADVVKGHPPGYKPCDLLPHIRSAIEANGNKPISDKWARELIRQARARKRRT